MLTSRLLLLLCSLLITPTAALGARRAAVVEVDPEIEARWVSWSTVEGPALSGRLQAADARIELARRHLAGEVALSVAWPHLAEAPLGSRAWLAARRTQLDVQALRRAQESRSSDPTLGSATRDAERTLGRDLAIAAEEAAESAERAVLLLLDDLVVRVPALEQASLDALRAVFDRSRFEIEQRWLQAEAEARPTIEAEALALQSLQDQWADAVRAAREGAARGPEAEADGEPVPAEAVAEGMASPLEAAVLSFRHALNPSPGTAAILRAWCDARGLPPDAPLDRPLELIAAAQRATEEAQLAAVEEARLAEESAQQAVQEAEAARREAHDARSRRVASIKEQVAAAKERASQRWSVAEESSDALAEQELQLEERLAVLVEEERAVRLLQVLDPSRAGRASAAWVELRQLIVELRRLALSARGREAELAREEQEQLAWVKAQAEELARARRFADEQPEGESRSSLGQALEGWQAALDHTQAAAEHHGQVRARAEQSVLSLVQRAKEQRRLARGITPRATVRRDREHLVPDLKSELSLLGPNVRSLSRRRLGQLGSLLEGGSGFAVLSAALVGSFWLVVGLLFWWWGRRQIPRLARPFVASAGRGVSGLFALDIEPFEGLLTHVGRAAADLLALSLLIGPTRARVPELAALLVLARLVALYQLLIGVFRLAVAPRDEGRPAFFRLERAGWKRADRAARMLLALVVLSGFTRFVTLDLLGTEALGSVAEFAFRWLLLAVLLVQLWRAEPALRGVVTVRSPRDRVGRWLEAPRGGFLLRPLRAGGAIVWLSVTRGWQIAQGSAREGTVLGGLVARLQSRSLDREEGEETQDGPIPQELLRDFSAAAVRADFSGLTELESEADALLQTWRSEEEVRGLIAVVGDRGHGKGRWALGWAAPLEAEGFEVVRLKPPGRIATRDALCAWLAESLGARPDLEALGDRLDQMKSTIFVVEELEHTFLRHVGGFGAIGALVELAAAHSQRHFWVFTCHAPAWRYLVRLRRVLNPDAFLGILPLPRRSGAALRQALEGAATELGLTLDCSPLIRPGTVSGDPAGDLERATLGYFRLLAEASRGNPGVAMKIWERSSRLAPGGGRIVLRLPEGLLDGREVELTDVEQLIAAALDVHGELSLEELALANNKRVEVLRPALRHLASRGVVTPASEGRVVLSLDHLPGVIQTLRRRHFVYGKE